MYDICHPSYYKIGQLGCQDKLKITTAFHVYIELCEERKLWEVDYKYSTNLDLIYLIAKPKKNSEPRYYIPWSTRSDIKLGFIEKIQKELNCKRFTLAIKSGETTSVFYNVTEGLLKPATPEEGAEKRLASHKKSQLEKKLKQNSRNLYDLAKSEKDSNS